MGKVGGCHALFEGLEVDIPCKGETQSDNVVQKGQAAHFYSPLWQGGNGVIAATGNGQTWTQHLYQHIPKWQKAANLYLHSCALVQPGDKTRVPS